MATAAIAVESTNDYWSNNKLSNNAYYIKQNHIKPTSIFLKKHIHKCGNSNNIKFKFKPDQNFTERPIWIDTNSIE